jgi:hypothetical protein
MKCRLDSVQYDPSRKPETGRSTRVIKAGSQEEQMIADFMESGLGLNSPELMPLDSSLNQDVHNAVNQHVIWTHHLKPGDPGFEKKFSRSPAA